MTPRRARRRPTSRAPDARALRSALPMAGKGQVIGLLGGSFDPAHAGHRHLTHMALQRLGLDQVWWLVSPGNPLKSRAPAPLAQRMAAARGLMRHPRVHVIAPEAALPSTRTVETLAALRAARPGLRFVWLMGADNLAGFHRWGHWREIAAQVPIAVFARPGQRLPALCAPAARMLRATRVRRARDLLAAPGWVYVDMPMKDESSTRLRAAGFWQTGQKT
jgi:nicotinate-nucleotide adenylyltransferase